MNLNDKNSYNRRKNIFRRIFYFFPLQLVVLHFKRNHLLMFFWLLLFLYITNSLGSKYGISSLFLAPEYMGRVDFWSFFLLGVSVGGFIMAFNIYSYIIHASEFPFLATLARPFVKFCYNNHFIPFLFVFTLFGNSYKYQLKQELISNGDIWFNLLGLGLGILSFITVATFYFIGFNKNVYVISGKDQDYFENLRGSYKEATFIREVKWYQRLKRRTGMNVETYMSGLFKINIARRSDHYDSELLKKVFAQNHINASIFETVLIMSFIGLGILREVDFMNIPAGASVMLLFTVFLLLFSALYSWFKGWTLTLLISALFFVNYGSKHFKFFRFENFAYGIDYSSKAEYTFKSLEDLAINQDNYDRSFYHTIEILNNWRKKNYQFNFKRSKKPKLILLNVSGGGVRSAMWTMHVMTHADSVLNGNLMSHIHLVTGASGGMIGMTYLREIYLRSLEDSTINIYDNKYIDNVCKDLLNPLTFSIATTDFFIRYQEHKDGGYSYTKDRGYFFEKRLIKNFEEFESTRLLDYYLPEKEAIIPMMIYSPTVANDGRRILISPQPISYLTFVDTCIFNSYGHSKENVEFTQLLKDNDPMHIKMSSVMRMNASFPYVLPMVSLPTNPAVELIDAGIRDNYGLKTSLSFLKTFKNWIATNTSGVIILEIRDIQKQFEIENQNSGSIMQRLSAPFSTFYGNVTKVHDYTNNLMLENANEWFDGSLDVVTFYLDQMDKSQSISMSFHLTQKDKLKILNAINEPHNVKALSKLKQLIYE